MLGASLWWITICSSSVQKILTHATQISNARCARSVWVDVTSDVKICLNLFIMRGMESGRWFLANVREKFRCYAVAFLRNGQISICRHPKLKFREDTSLQWCVRETVRTRVTLFLSLYDYKISFLLINSIDHEGHCSPFPHRCCRRFRSSSPSWTSLHWGELLVRWCKQQSTKSCRCE